MAAVLGACSSNDPAVRYCAQLLACACQPAPYSSAEVCAAELRGAAAQGRASVAGTDLVFDEGCAAEAAGLAEQHGCRPAAAVSEGQCRVCAEIHGDRQVGDNCAEDVLPGYSDCDRHLECVAGTCVDPCARLGEGQGCLDMSGNSLGACAAGLTCGFTTRRFTAPVDEGEACPTYTECAAELLCVNGTCTAPAAVGEGCLDKFACAAGAYCDPRDGMCRPRAELGEPFVDSANCASGGYCDHANVCAALPAAVCAGT